MKIIDHEFCADKGTLGAKCFHTLTTEERAMEKEQWDNERFGQICEKSAVFADWKKVIEEQCSYQGNCDYPETKQTLDFLKRAEKAGSDAKLGALP